MPLFTFSNRLAAEAQASYVLLSDGRYYRLRNSADLSAAESLRLSDISQRLRPFQADDGGLEVAKNRCLSLLVEMAGLLVEDAPRTALERHSGAELVRHISDALGEPDQAITRQTAEPDLGFAVMRAGAAYGVSPWEIWTTWPMWFLNASMDGIPRFEALEALQSAEWTALGSGTMKKGEPRRTQQRLQRDARGKATNGGQITDRQFLLMMNGGRIYI